MPDLESTELKTADLATLLDLTPRRVRQLAREGVFQRGPGRNFPLLASVRAYLGVKALPEAAEWLTRKARAEALLKEHSLEELKRRFQDPMGLWPQWLDVWNEHMQRITAVVLNSLPPRLVSIKNPHAVQDILRDVIFTELHRASDELEERTAEPYRTRFRDRRLREAAELATIEAAGKERRAKREKFERKMAPQGNGHDR